MVMTEQGQQQDVPPYDPANVHMMTSGPRPMSWSLATGRVPGGDSIVALTVRTETTTLCVKLSREDAEQLAAAIATTARRAGGLFVPGAVFPGASPAGQPPAVRSLSPISPLEPGRG